MNSFFVVGHVIVNRTNVGVASNSNVFRRRAGRQLSGDLGGPVEARAVDDPIAREDLF
jgi:hypothetical protein